MKRIGTTLLMIVGTAFIAEAQTALPYNNGFDTNNENADWILHRKGLTMVDGNPNHTWEPYASAGAVTPPNYLSHDYAVGYSGTQMTDDWLVSKSLNFTQGAKLSLKAWVYCIQDLMAGDSIEIYLLKGNQDPALATKTRVASLRSLMVNTGSFNSPTWKDTANIIIPATTGQAYLAIRYTTVTNWFTIGIDNLKLVANATSGIDDADLIKPQIVLYPNPAASVINWNLSSEDLQKLSKEEGSIINIQGTEVKHFPVKDRKLNIDFLSPGMYYMKVGNTKVPFTKL
jgi:hypothetical protein